MATQYKKFDVLNVSLAGENLIEAAAGTGKTYSIAIMVLRWILSTNHPIDSVLAVTFTNYATAELKERILNFLEKGLVFFEKPENCSDATVKKVCSRITDKNEAIAKLKKAVNDFDTASIFTIHGFCQKLIREHAFELGIDFKMELSEDADPANDTATAFFRQNIANCETTELLNNKKSREKISVKKLKDFISKAGIGIENKNIKLAVSDTPYADKIAEIYKDFAEKAPVIAKDGRDRNNVMGFNDILLIIYEALKNNESTSEFLLTNFRTQTLFNISFSKNFSATADIRSFLSETRNSRSILSETPIFFHISRPKKQSETFTRWKKITDLRLQLWKLQTKFSINPTVSATTRR